MNTSRFPTTRSLLFLLSLGTLLATAAIFTACDDATAPDTEIGITITQPTDSSAIRDTVVRIMADVTSNCGCEAYVEFHIDGVHQYSDYLPFFSFDWNIRQVQGWHVIATRVVVKNRGDAWDSVRVLIHPPDSLVGGSGTRLF